MMVIVRAIIVPDPLRASEAEIIGAECADIAISTADVVQVMECKARRDVLFIERHEAPDVLVWARLLDLVAKLNRS